MKFLKSFWNTLKGFFLKPNSTKTLDEKDIIGRFLTSSSHFSRNNSRVKYNALMPMKNSVTNEFESSVFNIEGLNSTQVKRIASDHLLPSLSSGRSVYGTGNTNSIQIESVGLTAAINEPPPRHLNIIGWPSDKSERKLLAMELANKCDLFLFQESITKS